MALRKNNGNAVFYVLLGVILFGLLGFAISKASRSPSIDYSAQEEEIAFEDFVSYATTLERAVQTMIAGGTKPSDIDFTAPTAGGFTTAPYGKKIFHPQGGGVEYRTQQEPGYAAYVYNKLASIVGLGTLAATGGQEIIFGAQVTLDMCRKLNKRFYKSNAILAVTTVELTTLLSGAAVEFNNNVAGKKHQCVTDLTGGQPAVENWQRNQPQTYYAGLPYYFPAFDLHSRSGIQNAYASAGAEIYVYMHVLSVK